MLEASDDSDGEGRYRGASLALPGELLLPPVVLLLVVAHRGSFCCSGCVLLRFGAQFCFGIFSMHNTQRLLCVVAPLLPHALLFLYFEVSVQKKHVCTPTLCLSVSCRANAQHGCSCVLNEVCLFY